MIYFSDFGTAAGGPSGTPPIFVGSKTFSTTTTTGPVSVSLTDLLDTAGSPATLAEGDLVLINLSNPSNTADRAYDEMHCPSYEVAHTDTVSGGGGNLANQLVQYKIMGATPDTTVAIPAATSTQFPIAGTIHAFRGVDPAVLDATPTTAVASSPNGLNNADPPAITPVTGGALIVACMAGSSYPSAVASTNPSGMSTTTNHFRAISAASGTNSGQVATALKTDWSSGSFDPSNFPNTDTTSGGWATATLAVRPDITGTESAPTGSYKTITIASGKVSSDLTNQVVMVNLADLGSSFWSGVAADGAGIRVTDSAGATLLPVDLANIDTGAQTGRLYFLAPSILSGSSNSWRIYYGTGRSALHKDNRIGRHAVWRPKFRVAIDGWSNTNRAAFGSYILLDNAAFSSGDLVLDGADDRAYIPIAPASTAISVMSVGYLETGGGTHKAVIGYCGTWPATLAGRTHLIVRSTGNWACYANGWFETGTAATFDANYTAALVHNPGTSRTIYVNGASAGTTASAIAIPTGLLPNISVGDVDNTPTEEMKGRQTLMLYADRVMTAAEIKCIHDNWRTTFYTVS